MLPAGGMPEAAVAGPGIAVKARPHVAGSDSVLRQPGFLEQIKQYNDRLHAVQTAEAVVDVAAAVHEPVCPRLNKLQIAWVPGALKDQILSVEIQTHGITPSADRRRSKPFHSGVNNGHRPIGAGGWGVYSQVHIGRVR